VRNELRWIDFLRAHHLQKRGRANGIDQPRRDPEEARAKTAAE
jgi:hypothetical protein